MPHDSEGASAREKADCTPLPAAVLVMLPKASLMHSDQLDKSSDKVN